MKKSDLVLFFILEVLAIVWAALVFSILPNKFIAGLLAGGYFIFSGLFMLARAVKWPKRWSSPTYYMLFIHVFVISLPMVLSRLWQAEQNFEDVRIMGMPGPVFHNLSSFIFTALMIATALDWVRCRFARS